MKPGLLTLLVATGAAAVAIVVTPAAADSRPSVTFRPATINLFHRTSVAVTGLPARTVDVRLKGATDAAGLAYEWTPYRWHRLRFSDGEWKGALPAPALLGVYALQVRVDGRRTVAQSPTRMLRVFRPRTLARPTFSTPEDVVRNLVGRLPGDEVVVALRRLRRAAYDHRDPRLHRIFAVAYAPRGDTRPGSRVGVFITTVRTSFHGRWRLLGASVQPYE